MRNYNPINYDEYTFDEVVIEHFLDRHHIETFDEFAYNLRMMSIACDLILKEDAKHHDLDAVAIRNLTNLKPLLEACSNMMLECDDYLDPRESL